MKIQNLIIGAIILMSSVSFGQETDEERECKRMRFLAGEELKMKNYPAAATYYLKGEKICGGYDKANYNRTIGVLRNVISTSKDKDVKTAYIDTLISVYDRAEKAGAYDPKNDLIRGTYIIQSSKPDRLTADLVLQRGIKNDPANLNEASITYYYLNLYNLYVEAADAEKPSYKKRLISEYFVLSTIIADTSNKVPAQTQENVNTYFNSAIKSCSDIIPELKGYMSELPQDVGSKKIAINNFISLLELKGCTDSDEYEKLIDILNVIDPSVDGKLAKAKLMTIKKRYNEAISAYKDAKQMTSDNAKKEEIDYLIAETYFRQGSYNSAYSAAMNVSGKFKGEALKMAGQCVAATANSCGASTVDRKCNYYYAVELLERAASNGASVGSLIGKYRSNYPTDGELFDNGMKRGQSVSLSCWNVSVTLK